MSWLCAARIAAGGVLIGPRRAVCRCLGRRGAVAFCSLGAFGSSLSLPRPWAIVARSGYHGCLSWCAGPGPLVTVGRGVLFLRLFRVCVCGSGHVSCGRGFSLMLGFFVTCAHCWPCGACPRPAWGWLAGINSSPIVYLLRRSARPGCLIRFTFFGGFFFLPLGTFPIARIPRFRAWSPARLGRAAGAAFSGLLAWLFLRRGPCSPAPLARRKRPLLLRASRCLRRLSALFFWAAGGARPRAACWRWLLGRGLCGWAARGTPPGTTHPPSVSDPVLAWPDGHVLSRSYPRSRRDQFFPIWWAAFRLSSSPRCLFRFLWPLGSAVGDAPGQRCRIFPRFLVFSSGGLRLYLHVARFFSHAPLVYAFQSRRVGALAAARLLLWAMGALGCGLALAIRVVSLPLRVALFLSPWRSTANGCGAAQSHGLWVALTLCLFS